MKTGLALGGGGSKGAFEMEAWQAVRELGLEFDLIAGTSIESINAAFMVSDDYEVATSALVFIIVIPDSQPALTIQGEIDTMMLSYLSLSSHAWHHLCKNASTRIFGSISRLQEHDCIQ